MDGSAASLPQAGWLLLWASWINFLFSLCEARQRGAVWPSLRLGNKRGIFALLAGLLLELQLLWSQ